MADDTEKPQSAETWLAEIRLAEQTFDKWERRSEKVIKRYRDDRGQAESHDRRFNILWANIQVLKPAVYSNRPKPEVSRRHKDSDPVGRVASQILERALEFEAEHYNDVHSAVNHALMDRFLPGRGVAWVRYEPTIEAKEVLLETEPDTDDVEEAGEKPAEGDTYESVEHECAPVEYVHWRDFLCSPARTWEELRWVARIAFMGKAEGNKRFGTDKFERVPMSEKPPGMTEEEAAKHGQNFQQAKVYEIWDKTQRKVFWLAKGYDQLLDAKDDPLELEQFFPCPKPLFATLTTDSLIPVPDYCMYQDQAEELDTLTQRIKMIVDACKVVGVYDSTQTALVQVLSTSDNRMIPVDNWAVFAERGGMKGSVDWMPIDVVSQVLERLYVAREQLKQAIYEITGISDILRGASKANETLGAQQIKANYGGLRLKELQSDVARFAGNLFQLKAEIMCGHYDPERLLKMAGVESIVTDADVGPMVGPQIQQMQQQIQGQMQQMQQAAQQNPAMQAQAQAQEQQAQAQMQQMVKQLTEQAKQQLVQQAVELLQSDPMRNFRIEVNSDSFIQLDEEAEKNSRVEFMQGMGQFAANLLPLTQAFPEMSGVVGEMLLFASRGFKAGRALESTLEQAMQKLENRPPPGPDPRIALEQEKAKAEEQRAQQDAHREDQKAQQTAALEGQRAQQEAQAQAAEDRRADMQWQAEMRQSQQEFSQSMQQQWQEFMQKMQMQRETTAANLEMKAAQAEGKQDGRTD